MDKTTTFGALLGSSLLLFGMFIGGSLSSFWDIPSILIVFGGAFGGTCIAFSYDRVRSALFMMKQCFIAPPIFDYLKVISSILATAEIARKEGILALDSKIGEIEDPFMARGLQLVVDGVDVKIIEEVLTSELDSRAARHSDVKTTMDFIASVAPAFGLIGTIIGLVGLLKNLNDPTTIGPNMAIALVTTFYGAVWANMFMIPFAKKVEERSNDEQLYGEIIARGCLLIAAGTHPRIIQERLLAYLNNKSRNLFAEIHLTEELDKGGKA